MNDKMIKITWKKSTIDRNKIQKATIRNLGLKKLNHSVIHKATPQILGMVNRVKHLVEVEEVDKK